MLSFVIGTAIARSATTTRYWDCSGGACGCGWDAGNNTPAHCPSNALSAAPAANQYGALFYGAAAISRTLGGGDWLAEGCGKCFKLTAQSNVPGTSGSKTIVVKATNFCPEGNPSCNGKDHFDLAAPAFDYPPSSLSNTCTIAFPDEKAIQNPAVCGYWMINS